MSSSPPALLLLTAKELDCERPNTYSELWNLPHVKNLSRVQHFWAGNKFSTSPMILAKLVHFGLRWSKRGYQLAITSLPTPKGDVWKKSWNLERCLVFLLKRLTRFARKIESFVQIIPLWNLKKIEIGNTKELKTSQTRNPRIFFAMVFQKQNELPKHHLDFKNKPKNNTEYSLAFQLFNQTDLICNCKILKFFSSLWCLRKRSGQLKPKTQARSSSREPKF